MISVVAHHLLIDAHPVSKQQATASPVFFVQPYMMPYSMEYSFGQLGSAVLAVSLPSLLFTPSLLTGGAEETEELSTWCEPY